MRFILDGVCIESILSAMQEHEEDVEVQKECCLALTEVDSSVGNHKSIFISANGKEIIEKAIVGHKDIDEMESLGKLVLEKFS